MATFKIKWSNLLNMAELDFAVGAPTALTLTDEAVIAFSLLTAATRHDRRLVRCDDNGALLHSDAWNGLSTVETDELSPTDGTPDTFTATTNNSGVLISTDDEIVKIDFYQVSGLLADTVYVPADSYYWYPHSTHTVVVTVVPASGGTASYVGLTAYN